MTCSHGGRDCDQLINKYLLRRHGGPGVCMCMAGGRVPHGHRQRLPPINSCEEANACKSHLSAVTVITSPLRLMLQVYLGISAASISIEDAAFRSSMVAAAGLTPSLELAIRISLSQVVTVPTSSRVPGMVGWSELGRVTNLGLNCHKRWKRGSSLFIWWWSGISFHHHLMLSGRKNSSSAELQTS